MKVKTIQRCLAIWVLLICIGLLLIIPFVISMNPQIPIWQLIVPISIFVFPIIYFILLYFKKQADSSNNEVILKINSIDLIKKNPNKFEFDFAFSFAGEDRDIARKVRDSLIKKDIKVFFDEDFEWDLIGKNLSDRFKEIYGKKSKYVVVFISKYYKIKEWTDFEFQIAREEAESRKEEFILPIRLDDTILLGIQRDIGYSDHRIKGTRSISDLLSRKLEDFNKRHDIK